MLANFDTLARRDRYLRDNLRNADALPTLITAAHAIPDQDPRIPDLCAALAVIACRAGNGALAQAPSTGPCAPHPGTASPT